MKTPPLVKAAFMPVKLAERAGARQGAVVASANSKLTGDAPTLLERATKAVTDLFDRALISDQIRGINNRAFKTRLQGRTPTTWSSMRPRI